MSNVSRRTFLTTTAAGTGFTILPRHVLGRGFQAPSDTVNIATVGFGGMGGSNTRRLMRQNIVAICDVDDARRCAAEAHGGRCGECAGRARATAAAAGHVEGAGGCQCASASDRQRGSVAALHERADPALKRYRDYRQLLDKQKDSMRSWSRHRITCMRSSRSQAWI